VRNNPLTRIDTWGLWCEDYLDYLEEQAAEDAVYDYIMGEGFSEYVHGLGPDTLLDLLPNEGFAFGGVEAKEGPYRAEVLALAGVSGPFAQPNFGVIPALGYGPFIAAYDLNTAGSSYLNFFELDLGLGGWGRYTTSGGSGYYVFLGHSGFVGFALGRSNE